MRKMNNLEYFFIAIELDRQLSGKHFSRIRKIGESTYRMKIAGFEVLAENRLAILLVLHSSCFRTAAAGNGERGPIRDLR